MLHQTGTMHATACRTRAIGKFVVPVLAVTVLAGRADAQCATWELRPSMSHPAAGSYHAAAYDSDRHVTVVFSGVNGAPNNETWEWDGVDWSQKSPMHAPLPRHTSAMVYDSARHVCVMFGGSAFDPVTGQYDSNETWEWNGTDWTQRSPTTSPPGRYLHAMAYDSTRHVTVLFGGFHSGGSGHSADTWEYDGATWTERSPAHSPAARDGHAMAFDIARGVTVLFGGQTFVTSHDTWEWNGTDWTERHPVHPPTERRDLGLAYDSTRGVTVLFGGTTPPNFMHLGTTVEWDGNDWSLLQPTASPIGREGPSMVYDSFRKFTVLFGGNNLGDISSTFELDVNVSSSPQIDTQPLPADRCVGTAANFFIAATGLHLSYQWQVSTDGGATFHDVTTGMDATTPSYTTSALALGDNGNQYQCVVTGDCGVRTSNAAALTVKQITAITTHPGNVTAVIQPGVPAPKATFTVAAVGTNLSYQWEQSTDNGEIFNPVTTGVGGNTAAYQSAGLNAVDTGTRYRCIVTGLCGSTTSNFATVTVQDASGVSNAVEDGAPNGGDGNNDGIPDRLQDNVTSLPNANGDYVTLASPSGTNLGSVVSQGNPSPADAPAGVQFPAGFLKFNVNNVAVGGMTTIKIILPVGVNANDYWKFGPEPGNPTPHWYDFRSNGTTGAVFNDNEIVLTFVDGGRGDADLTANGTITDPGAPAIQASPGAPQTTVPCGACGAGTTAMMPMSFLMLTVKQRRRPRRSRTT